MSKRILIFCDGTGNEGGLLPDESRTNVYKLYRATRTGPDSTVDPHSQLAFYVQGVGTYLPGHTPPFYRSRSLIQEAIGLGLKDRMRAAYKAIIGTWRPGDSIFLFGFSRGAYTARCVAHLLEVFGIPSKEPSSETVSLDPDRLEVIAKRAVNIMYRMGMLIPDGPERRKKVADFARDYAPRMGAQDGVVPYFLGLWDSVAAYGLGKFFPHRYDPHLPRDIAFVRHALSIDEIRRDFKRVPFGGSGTVRQGRPGEPEPFQQVWFAGNHSDIGGSYPENESRLSDITLKWMLNFLTEALPPERRISYDSEVLKLYPSPAGMMHDETQSSKVHWLKTPRLVDPEGTLHESVIERLKLKTAREHSGYKPYRPEPLRNHPEAAQFFTEPPSAPKASLLQRLIGFSR